MLVRPAAVAGSFYPADATELAEAVDGMLAEAKETAEVHSKREGPSQHALPKALIVPHAGYIYSGPIAARGFVELLAFRGAVERVVVVGPAHRVAIRGLALPEADAFETPLGLVSLDISGLCNGHQVPRDAIAHRMEHSLEVQLPFLTRTLGTYRVVPLVAGNASMDEVASVLEAVWGGPETLIVVSSDLSHYLPYQTAKRMDEMTAQAIVELAPEGIDDDRACGARCVRGLLALAKSKQLRPRLLDLRSSGDTAGSPNDRVVGYGSFAFYA